MELGVTTRADESPVGYYDHDRTSDHPLGGPLSKIATELGWTPLYDEYALAPTSQQCWQPCRVAFVHFQYDQQWRALIAARKATGASIVLVRVYSEGSVPVALESEVPLSLRMIPQMKYQTAATMARVADALLNEGVQEELRLLHVPQGLRSYFQFVTPHYLAGMWIAGLAHLSILRGEDLPPEVALRVQAGLKRFGQVRVRRSGARGLGSDRGFLWRPFENEEKIVGEISREIGCKVELVPAELLALLRAAPNGPSDEQVLNAVNELARILRIGQLD